MNLLGYVLGAGVLASLVGIAVSDARRMVIPPALLAFLLVAGIGWLGLGGGFEAVGASFGSHAAAGAAGVGAPLGLIWWAERSGRRWPIYPGDALLLGALGTIVGVRGLLWVVTLGSALALIHRVCIQRRRGRPVTSGYLPAGPGLAVGAAAVFVFFSSGGVLAQEKRTGETLSAPIEATELAPVRERLPAALTSKPVTLEIDEPLPFSALVERIGAAAGVAVVVEERPARVSGGGVELAEPGEVEAGGEETLGPLLDDVARRAGYAWEWSGGKIVFYRYWDRSWPVPASVVEAPASVVEVPPKKGLEGVFAWLGRLFAQEVEAEDAPVAVPDPETEAMATEGADKGDASKSSEKAADRSADIPGGEDGKAQPRTAEEKSGTTGGPGGTADPAGAEAQPTTWEVDPVAQKTVRGVLEDWAERANWRVAWRSKRDFYVGASATFEGEFLAAVDQLLSDPQVSRALVARAHSNRYLVVEGASR